jgi:superfamily II DNA or RNA helicase
LAKIFERFKEWLTQIYNGIKGSDIDLELNDGMRVIYSEMLGADTVTKDFPKKPKVAKPKAEPKKIADYTIIEKSNRLTMPVVDSITVDGNPIETGMPFSIKTYRGTGGGSTVSMPFGSVVPDATFYALSETTAKMYGKEVIEATLDIKNPLVIDSDAQLKSLGINTSEPNPFTKKAFQDALEKHDAVVIIVSPVYDSNAKGENSKRLRKIFDHTQIFTRKEVAKPKSEQAKVKADKARDELKGLMDDFIKDFGSDLNAGLNPQAIGASAKIIAKGAELGFRKFEQFGYFVIENFGADKFKSIYQSFKAAYMANIGVDNQFNEDLNAISKLSADQVIKQYEAQDETTADIQVEPEGAIDVAEGAEVIQPGLADQRTAVRVQRVQGDRQGAPAQKETTPGQRPAMIYASRSMPEPKLYIDETSYPFIDEHQIFGVNLMLEAFETGKKGFMLADSTGIGKTAQILTVANELVNRGKKVLILTQNQQIIDGSFTNDSQMLGIDKNKFTITTYTQLGAGKVKGQYDVVIYDEAHNLKNPDSLRSSAAQGLNTAFSIFATATPMDTSTSAVYFMEKVTGQSREQIYRRMGLNVVERVNRKTNQTYVTVEPMKGFNIKELPKRLIEIREDMIRDGVMVRREYPFYGEVSETSVSVNQDFADMIEAASDYWFDKMEGLPPHILKNIKGQYVLEMARLNELSKVDDTFNMAMKELKEGRSVVIIGETAGKQTIKGLSETLQALSSKNEFDGALTQLARKFKEKGFDTANIYGAGDKSSEVDRFQRGDVRIALATPQSGGTGINLDDSIGGKPRTLIMMTANFSGNQFQQIIGRVSRRNTKTPAKFTILMNDTTSDSHKRGKVADKLATLKAIQDGVLGEFSDFDNVAKTSEELAPSSEGLPVAPSGFSYISTGKDIFEVRGDTYPIKMVLKEVLGGRYRGSTKGWEFNKKDAEKVDQAVRDFYKNNTDGDLDNSISPSALPPQAIEPTDPGMQSMLEQSTRSKIMEKVKSLPGKLFKPKPATGEVLTSRQDITEHVIKKLEVTVAKGRAVGLGRNLGIYRSKPYSKLIALKIANDIDTLAHEVGHYVHDILFDMKTPKEFDSELHQLGLATSRPSYSEEQIIREGQAEFFRHLMISPNAAYQRAPMYYEAFIQRLKYDSELNDAISELQAMFQRYLAQSPMQRFTAHIAYDGKNTVPRSPNEETIPQMLYRNVYNDLIPLQRMTKDLTGKNFLKDATQDAFVLAEMAAGVPGMVEGWIRFGVTLPDGERLSKGIEQIFEEYDIKGKKKYLDFSNYLAAKRIVELYEQAFEGKRKLKMGDKDGSLGISYKDAKAVLAELESDTFSKAAKDVYEWSDGILEYLVYRGYASKEQVNAIRSANMNYVPLNRVMDETEEASSGSGKSLANRPRGFKMLFGSGRRILPPIEQLIINASRLASNAERNNAAVKAFELIGKSPNGGLWADKVTRPIAPVEGQLAEIEKSIRESFAGTIEDSDVIDEIIQQMNLSETFQLWRPIAHNRSNMEVAININGRTNIWRVNDRTLYNALTLKDSRTTNVFVRLLTIPKGIKRTGIVVSPSFWTGVTQADQYIAIITTKFGYLPLRIGKYGISSDYINGVIAQITENETYKAWLNSRASISGVIDQSRPNVKRTLNRSAETKLERIIKDVIIPTRWIQALESFASIFENATRIGEFSRGMQIQGKGELGFTKAGYASRNVSADFARSGQWARFVGTAKAFFNAGLQGDLAWFQAAKRNPVGFFAKGLLFMSLPQLALNYLLRDNEDYEERVAERELYWLIPTSSDFKNNTNWYRVRKPWNLGVFFGSIIPSVYQEAFLEGQKPMLDYLFPTPEDAMAVITSMIPDVIMPFMEVMSGDQGYNYFFQQSIDPYWDKDLEPYMRYDDRNSTAEIKLGRVLNRSPRKIRHLIRGYFGTAGMEFSDLLGATIDQIEASEKPPKPSLRPGQNIPGVRPFVSPYLSANRAISVQQFYEIKDAATRVYNTNKAITDPVEGDIYQRENKFLIDTYSDIVKEDNKLRKIKDDISATYVDPDMSPDDKRIKINRLNKEIIDTAKRFIERQKQLEKELE